MTTQVNFTELKQNVSMENLLGHYGLLDGMKRVKEDELVGLCPFHEETRGSFHVSTSKNAWNCFGCDGKGNILDFVMAKENVGVRAAGLMIQEWFPGSPQSAPERPKRRERQPRGGTEPTADGNPALTFELKNLDAKHPYLLEERGLDPKTVAEFGLGYCSRGLMNNRVVIPVHDEHGQLVAYAGRYPAEVVPEEEPKYLVPPNWQKSLVLFNYHRALEEVHEKRELIVVEGFFALFRVWQAGYRNVVALMGNELYPAQTHLLQAALGEFGRVTLMLDNDAGGKTCEAQCVETLVSSMYVKVVRLPDGVADPDQLTDEQIDQLLVG